MKDIKIEGNSFRYQNKSGYLMRSYHLTNFNGEEVNLQHSHKELELPEYTLSKTGEKFYPLRSDVAKI
jgi:hypothetical protein